MSQEDVDLVRAGYEDFYRGDFAALLEKVDPDVVTERLPPLPDPGVYHGHEGMLKALADWTEDFEDFDMRAEEVTDVGGGRLVVRIRQRARGRGSGAEVEGEFWFVHENADGRLVRLDMFAGRDQAFDSASERR
jgi:ketosteroid isomerase-like protein